MFAEGQPVNLHGARKPNVGWVLRINSQCAERTEQLALHVSIDVQF
jgi:hypothetical protein